MTVPDDDAYDDAVTGIVRRPQFTLEADWGRDGTYSHPLSDLTRAATSVTVERSVSGELPAEVGLVEGYGSASLSVDLGGRFDGHDEDTTTGSPAVYEAFAPYKTDAELFGDALIGTEVRLGTGLVTEQGSSSDRQFTGLVSRVSRNSGARTVAVDALDASTRLRATITQAPIGMDSLILAAYGSARYSARFNSQWLIDRCFRASRFYASPPPQPGSFLSATMHGSSVPEVGSGGVPQQASAATPAAPRAWTDEGHPFGMLYPAPGAPAPYGTWTAPVEMTTFPGDGYGCSFWMRAPTTPVTDMLMGIRIDGGPLAGLGSSGVYAVFAYLAGGAPAMLLMTPGDGAQGVVVGDWTLPATPEWHHIGMHWGFPEWEVCELTLAVDGQAYQPLPITFDGGPPRISPFAPTISVEYLFTACMTNICWWKSPRPPDEWVGAQWSSQADIDPGLGEFTGIPQIAGEDGYELLKEVVGAEYGQVGFSTAARPYFRSRAVDRERGTPERVTSQRELADLAVVTDEASVRNSISSAVTPLLIGDYEWVVEATEVDQFDCGPGASYFTVPLPADTAVVDPPYVSQRNAPGFLHDWDAKDRADWRSVWIYCAVYAATPHVPVSAELISMRLFPGQPGTVTFAVFNFSGATIRFQVEDELSDPDPETGEVTRTVGEPAFLLPGRLLKPAAAVPQVITDPGSVARYGVRTYELGGGSNRWHQHQASTAGVAEAVLPSTAHPCPVLDAVTVRHSPRRELGGPIVVADPRGLGEVQGSITRIATDLGAPTLDELAVRPLAPPGFGLLGDEALGGVGTTLRFGA